MLIAAHPPPPGVENQFDTPVLQEHEGVCVCEHASVHLVFSVESGMVLQQEVCHLCVAVVTGHVQRSVSQLDGEKTEK